MREWQLAINGKMSLAWAGRYAAVDMHPYELSKVYTAFNRVGVVFNVVSDVFNTPESVKNIFCDFRERLFIEGG